MAGRHADAGRYAADNTGAASLPYLRAQKSGAIVNVSSMGGQMSFPRVAAYSASKFALEGLSEALAQELAPFGIKVMIVDDRGARRTPDQLLLCRHHQANADCGSLSAFRRHHAGFHA
jgi:NAD(P)-dependent dehydrogenase (short-subunit alcohol dehydrogenase family)